MITPLITKEIISRYRDISKQVTDAKIGSYIHDAEILDLKPMLGSQLYNDLVQNLSTTENQRLMNGGSYIYNGEDFYFTGLERVLSLLAYSRYIMFGSSNDTGMGLVQKSYQDSTPISEASKRNMYDQERKAAIGYFADVKEFLGRNKVDYPKYTTTCGNGGYGGFRVSKIV